MCRRNTAGAYARCPARVSRSRGASANAPSRPAGRATTRVVNGPRLRSAARDDRDRRALGLARLERVGLADAVGVVDAAGRAVAVVAEEDRRAVGGARVTVILVLQRGADRRALAGRDRAARAGEAAVLDQRD